MKFCSCGGKPIISGDNYFIEKNEFHLPTIHKAGFGWFAIVCTKCKYRTVNLYTIATLIFILISVIRIIYLVMEDDDSDCIIGWIAALLWAMASIHRN